MSYGGTPNLNRSYSGWKGLECQLKHDECEVADCNGHGKCVNGVCVCSRGFTGPSCEQSKFKSKSIPGTCDLCDQRKYKSEFFETVVENVAI